MGEYAVLTENAPALIWAVDRYLHATLKPASQWRLQSDLWPNTLSFDWREHQLQGINAAQNPFVFHALFTAFSYLESQQALPKAAELQLASDLVQQSVKLGLGSSAAVTVAIIGALLIHAGSNCIQPSGQSLLLKLAQSAHEQAQPGGSGGDLASTVYGGVIHFSRQGVMPQVVPMLWPEHFILAVGWTGHPAATTHYLPLFRKFQSLYPDAYRAFVRHSNQNVNLARQAIESQNFALMATCWHQSHEGLVELNQQSGMGFMTPSLLQGIELAQQLGLSAKQSGAGGGDCILALCPDQQSHQKITATWLQHGIQPLALQTGYPRLMG